MSARSVRRCRGRSWPSPPRGLDGTSIAIELPTCDSRFSSTLREIAVNHPNDTSGVLETAAATAASVASELSATVESAAELARAAGRLADQRVRERPWQTALAAAGLG